MNRRMQAIAAIVILAAVIQVIPYGRSWTNPPVQAEPAWNAPRTRELAVAACFACHSNQVERPWYGNIAPVSWYVQHDIEEGRSKLNFSEWNRSQEEAGEAAEKAEEGEMPPIAYRLVHGEARLSADDKATLVAGLEATLGRKNEGQAR